MKPKLSILFMGRKNTARQALQWLATKREIVIRAVIIDIKKQELKKYHQLKNLKILSRAQAEKNLTKGTLKIDLGLSVLYRKKIRSPIINNCKYGVINFHPAPLPDYKGNAGYNIAILKNLKKWAASAHYVDEKFDTGPIIKKQIFKINPVNETALSLEKKTAKHILVLFRDMLSRLISKPQKLPAKANIGGIYVSRLQMEAMKKVYSSDNIDKKIRAFWYPPYSGASISIKGKNYTLVNEFILKQIADRFSRSK